MRMMQILFSSIFNRLSWSFSQPYISDFSIHIRLLKKTLSNRKGTRLSQLFHDLLHFRFYMWYSLDLNVDFIVFDATDLAVIEIIHLTSTDDLENRGQCYLLWPLVHHGLCTWYKIISTFELIISDVGNLKMTDIVTWPPQLTSKIKVKHTFKWPLLSLAEYMLQTWF